MLREISGPQRQRRAIVFDGRDITHMPPHEVAARGVVSMPGGRGVFPGLTVRENLALGGWLAEDEDVDAALAQVYDIFPALVDRADILAGALSGGEQQQLSLAQAFLAKPKLLLIDELSLGLSPAVVAELLDVVRAIHRSGVTVVVVEQSVNIALTLADRAVFMEKGEVRFFGATADLLRRPDILRAVYVKGTGALEGVRPVARRAPAVDAPPVLEVQGLTKRYGGVVALDDVSLTVTEGEVLGVIGPNGSGKTTLFDVVSGFVPPDEGAVLLRGLDVTDASAEGRAPATCCAGPGRLPVPSLPSGNARRLHSQLEVGIVVLARCSGSAPARGVRARADACRALQLCPLPRTPSPRTSPPFSPHRDWCVLLLGPRCSCSTSRVGHRPGEARAGEAAAPVRYDGLPPCITITTCSCCRRATSWSPSSWAAWNLGTPAEFLPTSGWSPHISRRSDPSRRGADETDRALSSPCRWPSGRAASQ